MLIGGSIESTRDWQPKSSNSPHLILPFVEPIVFDTAAAQDERGRWDKERASSHKKCKEPPVFRGDCILWHW